MDVKERSKVIFNMHSVVDNLTDEQRKRAFYISKFIASCGVGLFDAALNFLWNETILNLREKIIRFDIDYFYDSITGDASRRSNFKTEDDLKNLDDWELIRGCRETGIITDIGYKHLDYIRDMRNFASAAHPNQNQLTGFQVLSWLETCILEVLAKEPSGPVLNVKKLLHNIRTETLGKKDVEPIKLNIQTLPKDLANSSLRAIFGMYVDEDISTNVRDNIDLVSKTVWDQSDEDVKHNIGLKYAIFSANAEIKRKELANGFLSSVDGLTYLTEEQLAIEMNERLESLLNAHYEYNNFYNEEPHAKVLLKYIPRTGAIPESVRYKYVKVLVICRLGNFYGISFTALPYYNEMIEKFRNEEIFEFLNLLKDSEIIAILDSNDKLKLFFELVELFKNKTKNEILKSGLIILQDSKKIDITYKKTYRDIIKLFRGE